MMIVVAATEHPELDNWVFDEARAEAARSDLLLGEYLGREDVLPQAPPDACLHVFAAARLGTPEVDR
jgi:hypothetical protein